MKKYLALTAQGVVVNQLISRKEVSDDPAAGITHVEVDSNTFATVLGRLRWDEDRPTQKGSPRFRLVNGNLQEIPDARPQLRVTVPSLQGGFVDLGSPTAINFTLLNAAGSPITPTRRVPLLITRGDGQRTISLSLVNGVAAVSPTLPEGAVLIESARSDLLRVVGDFYFVVTELW